MGMENVLGDVIVLGMAVKVMEKTGLMNETSSRKRKSKKKEGNSFLDW